MPTARLAQLEKLLKLDPNDPFVLYGIAQEHAKDGPEGHAAALGWYDRCLSADPAYCYAYYHKALSQLALGRRSDAADTVAAGQIAARRCNDAKALNELTGLGDTLR